MHYWIIRVIWGHAQGLEHLEQITMDARTQTPGHQKQRVTSGRTPVIGASGADHKRTKRHNPQGRKPLTTPDWIIQQKKEEWRAAVG